MGVVYRARDTHLDRTVAIKVLPADKVFDHDRRQRFVREAKAASALNHPNIVTVHDIRSDAGVDFIVMEHVEGRTLDEVIPPGGLGTARSLHFAIQMTDALARAHEAGIVHRDLKPSNVIVTAKDAVKIVDFGLAKLTDQVVPATETQTHASSLTAFGTIVGTASYMSPEQAEGRTVDARSDVFSFGAVLYEMVTGERAFQGDSPLSVLAKVLNADPPLPSARAASIPAELERAIMRCLRKDPARRYQTMADLKIALEDLAAEPALPAASVATVPASRSWRWAWAALIPIAGAVVYLGLQALRAPGVGEESAPHIVPLTALAGIERFPSFSPDGNSIAFTWNGERQDNADVYVQQIGVGGPLRLTNDPGFDHSPAWSPDGRSIAFLRRAPDDPRRHELRLIAPLGGLERKVTDIRPRPFLRLPRVSWCPDSKCVVVTDATSDDPTKPGALFVVSVDSGDKRQLTFPESHFLTDSDPAISPDGRSLVFRRDTAPFSGQLYFVDLAPDVTVKGTARPISPVLLIAYWPDWISNDEIVFSAKGALWRLKVAEGNTPQRLAIAGEDGVTPAVSRAHNSRGGRLAYARSYADANIWKIDLPGVGVPATTAPTQVIASTRRDALAQFSHDGRAIAFMSDRLGEWEIWKADASGANAVKLTSLAANPGYPQWSPDDRTISFHSNSESHAYGAVWTVPAEGGRARQLTRAPATEVFPSFSHDGSLIYFSSARPGRATIFKMPASGGDPTRVSQTAGMGPLASPDGAYVYYVETTAAETLGPLLRIPVAGGPAVKVLDRVLTTAYCVLERGIYYLDREPRDTTLRFFDFASTQSTIVARNLVGANSISVSPDGRTVLFSRNDATIDDLILIENFR